MHKSTLKTRFFSVSLALMMIGGFMAQAKAQLSLNDPDEAPKVTAQLIAEHDGIKPAGELWVALRQDITAGWHTYWKNPGDTGLASAIKWDLPQGYQASELLFPTPSRHPMAGMMNFGYEDNVMLMTKITAPVDAAVGSKISLKAQASWLVCKEICIPEKGTYTLDLIVTNEPSSSPWQSAFTAARKKLPATHTAHQKAKIDNGRLIVDLYPLPVASDVLPEEAFFFPHDGLLIDHVAEQELVLNGRGLRLVTQLNKARSAPIDVVSGDVWVRSSRGDESFAFHANVEQDVVGQDVASSVTAGGVADGGSTDGKQAQSNAAVKTDAAAQTDMSLFGALLFAFLGGLLLNLMPCVFPVLSLKALGLVQKSHHETRREVIGSGLAYLAGVIASFTLLGIVLISLKTAGGHIGWGLQLQSPVFVASVALLLFFIGFVLIGGINIGSSLMGMGQSLTQKSGYTGSFFTGALAVIVATPCTAPFMGGAIFFALTQHWTLTLLVLWALGIGLALPYVLLTLFPHLLLNYLPKPGVWMENFKQFLAFPMWGAAIWLVWVLSQQNGSTGVLYILSGMLFLSFGFWLWQTMQNRKKNAWHYFKGVLAVCAVLLAIMCVVKQPETIGMDARVASDAQNGYEIFDAAKLQEYREAGKPVFVNMTAAWCITCLANEKAALVTDAVRDAFAARGIVYMKGDWTNYDDAITEYLKEFGRSGVPIYVYYPAGKGSEPVVLPQLLTPSIVLDHLAKGDA